MISLTDALSRGSVNVRANWQTILTRAVQSVVSTLVTFGALFVVFGSVVFAVMRGRVDPKSFNLPAFGAAAFAAIAAIIVVNLLLSAYVTAGNGAELLHGARAGGKAVFDFERWRREAGSRMLSVLLIYVIFALFAAATIVVVALVFGALGALTRSPLACCAVVLLLPLLLPLAVFLAVWSTKAAVLSAGRERPATAAISEALELTRSALWVNLGAAGVVALVAIIGAVVVGGVFAVINLAAQVATAKSKAAMLGVALPLQMLGTLLQQIWLAITGCWFVAVIAELIEAETPRTAAAPPELPPELPIA